MYYIFFKPFIGIKKYNFYKFLKIIFFVPYTFFYWIKKVLKRDINRVIQEFILLKDFLKNSFDKL